EEALEYLNKILDVNHRVLEPITYFETVVCNNLGWIYYNLGRYDEAYNLLNKAVASFNQLGINNTTDYFAAKNNLALVCIQREKYLDALNNYFNIRDSFYVSMDSTGEIAINTNYGIVLSLLKLNRIQEAYDFACEELNRFEHWFGETSRIRVKAIIQMGGLFREFGFQDCKDFFMIAEEQITKADDYKSLNYARLLNYIGVCKSDYEQMHVEAEDYLQKAKSLFEEINAISDEFYPVVIKNLKQIKVLAWNELVNGLINKLP
ncbi:MAG: tetratricopeptide repeat protein, partial [Clostridia bacterium]|nr:tetratricopeptide repeat protein [Clostridia bacterium]